MPEAVIKCVGIGHAGKPGLGAFKLSETQLGWAPTDAAGSTVSFVGKEISKAVWQKPSGKNKGLLKLRFKANDNSVTRFSGFRQEDFLVIKDHMKRYFEVDLLEETMSLKGWSWYDWNLDNPGELRLMSDGKAGVDVALEDLNQVTTAKNEISLMFHEDKSAAAEDDCISEMRFALPMGDVRPELSAEELKDELQKRTGLSGAGEAIAKVSDIAVVQPRGRHDFEFFQDVVKIHGKTQTYTVRYTTIAHAFLLDLPDNKSAVVLHVDPPLRHGQKVLQSHLVLTFDNEKTTPADLPEKLLKAMNVKAGHKVPVHLVVAHLIRELAKKTLITPTSEFKVDGHSCIRCSLKTQPGLLFPMKKSMLFMPKPVTWIKYEEVESIEFKSNAMRKASFDILIQCKRLSSAVEFSQLDRNKAFDIKRFFVSAKLPVMNAGEVDGWNQASRHTSSRGALDMPLTDGKGNPDADDDEEADEDYKDDDDDDDDDDEDSSGDDDDDEPSEDDLEPKKKRAKK